MNKKHLTIILFCSKSKSKLKNYDFPNLIFKKRAIFLLEDRLGTRLEADIPARFSAAAFKLRRPLTSRAASVAFVLGRGAANLPVGAVSVGPAEHVGIKESRKTSDKHNSSRAASQ